MNEVEAFCKQLGIIAHFSVTQVESRFFEGSIVTDSLYYGKYLGEKRKGKFVPSSLLVDFIGEQLPRFVVNKRGAWLFLCGRDVLPESIVSRSTSEGYVGVVDESGHVLGYGFLRDDMIMNSWDKGYLLRREIKN